MIRLCEGRRELQGQEDLPKDYLCLDETIWEKGREYFNKHKNRETIPVLDRNNQVVCYAWKDNEADREMRMLRELERQEDVLTFRDIYPECPKVVIHDCNELAWYMREYLIKCGVHVNVDGRFWEEIGVKVRQTGAELQDYEIWAEGIHRRSGDWKQERLRSASVEFEVINKIYEENIKDGRISDIDTDLQGLLNKLRQEKEIVIRGTGTRAQDAYNWLVANGIDICAFQSGRQEHGRKRLFGKPILRKEDIKENFKEAVILECGCKNSAWGFGDVDAYDYEGYTRNRRYFLLQDYLDVPEENLLHVLEGKRLVFTGDVRLCRRAARWYTCHGVRCEKIVYWDVFSGGGYNAEAKDLSMQQINRTEVSGSDIVMLILPQYSYLNYVTKEAAGKRETYIKKFREYGIEDWSEYLSDTMKCIHLETDSLNFRKKELQPAGILMGVIPGFSGNILVRQSLAGHSNIMMIEEGTIFNDELYYICIRLAEENASDILPAFWTLYEEELYEENQDYAFYHKDKKKFNEKMKELLSLDKRFTSQELFVMFHLAYEAMYGIERESLANTIIYWEPHMWKRECVREWACWLNDKHVKGFILNLVRNSYARAGSAMRYETKMQWETKMSVMRKSEVCKNILSGNIHERTIKFEDLKCDPTKILTELCEWMGICFENVLLETTIHGEVFYYDGVITGFDVKPAYNLYEEFFDVFDRMRICMLNRHYQKEYGYPYMNCLDFSRRELQEMFLRNFRWEKSQKNPDGKTEESVWRVQRNIRRWLWNERFSEVMEEIDRKDT